jgi:diguanylate cyclase (GGDEF)-like protein
MGETGVSCQALDNYELEEVSITPQEYNDILDIQQKILGMIASRGHYKTILENLCTLAEKLLPNSVASIMLVDQETGLMSVLSAPSIPQVGHDALKNLQPGSGGGSCGNAVFRNEAQYVINTFEDGRWKDLRKVAVDFNLCSCWSMPVRDEDNHAIGTFALSSFEHRSPAPFHKKLLETASSIVNIVLKNQENEQKIEQMLYNDSLTNLHNKVYLEKVLRNYKNRTLILLNVNNFSYINTAYGFETGDKLLIKIAKILEENFSTKVTCRINADEFALLFDENIDIKSVVSDIQKCFYSQEITIDNITLNISFSYGGVYGSTNKLRNGALALKQAKENGKNKLYIYNQDENNIDNTQRESFIEINNLVHNALNEDKFVPYFQGIRNNTTKQIVKFESLVRIIDNGEIISPYKFLEVAKLSGLLPEITKVMVEKTFKIMSDNNYTFSINITEDDLSQSYLTDYLQTKALFYKIKPSRVILEILEGISSDGKKNHIKQLKKLKSQGYSIAIDDFGTEYSNFERVLDLDIDFLKIDAKYIKDIHTSKKSYEITKAISFFAKNTGIPCIAEFVHNKEVQEIIEDLGIDYSQGYYFSEPTEEPISEE